MSFSEIEVNYYEVAVKQHAQSAKNAVYVPGLGRKSSHLFLHRRQPTNPKAEEDMLYV